MQAPSYSYYQRLHKTEKGFPAKYLYDPEHYERELDVFYYNMWIAVGREDARRLGGMSLKLFRRKTDVIKRHCEHAGRDPAEIKHTVFMPTMLTDDQAEADKFIRRVGPGTVAGSAEYIIQRMGEFADAGAYEIMLAPRPSDAEAFQRLDEEVLTAFA